MEILPRKFYQRDPKKVAKSLIGKKLVRKIDGKILSGLIVETEAYYGESDPASRAFHGMKNYNKQMWGLPGTVFIYNVHKYWMLNVVAHKKGEVGAVLIRAIHPIEGISLMKRNRGVNSEENLTNGPGRLSVALKINKDLNGIDVTKKGSKIVILNTSKKFRIGTSHRIGVKKDLKEELRFFAVNDPFVSR